MRRVPTSKPDPEVYAVRCECLQEWEQLSEFGDIDLYYGDESGVCLRPYVPYGWQFRGEKVTCPSQHGGRLNCFALYCFALLRRDNTCFFAATEGRVTGQWLGEQIDRFSPTLTRLTLIVLDNAPVHKKMVNDYGECWEERGLFVGFLPPYSPHLNIVEILWKKLKYEWLDVRDYASKVVLHARVREILSGVGEAFTIAFRPFTMPKIGLT